MSELNITIPGGTTQRLKTAGKYCDRDILVTAEGGGGGSVEAWTGTVYRYGGILGDGSDKTIFYVDETSNVCRLVVDRDSEHSITITAGTFVAVSDNYGGGKFNDTTNATLLYATDNSSYGSSIAVPTANNFELYL